MQLIWEGLKQALALIFSGDPQIMGITLLSLQISLSGTLISLFLGVPVGVWLALYSFPGRRALVSLVNAGMGLPPVVVGLIVSIFLWRSGPFGLLHIIYTPTAMIIAQAVIASPVVAGLTIAAIQQIDPKFRLQVLGLGASSVQSMLQLLREARLPLLAAVMAGFGAVISEVGAATMVGGNILGQTRVLTTAMVLETSKGDFAAAMALGVILLILVYAVNVALTLIQQRRKPQ
ncbi:MAG: ABC transporter permease [Chloroflexi bacterium]|nr:ABC transporter permease [Chloroflexota bacterium]